MAGKPAEPDREHQAQTPARVQTPALPDTGTTAREERERVGPLAVERRVKADGRALILYSEDGSARDRK